MQNTVLAALNSPPGIMQIAPVRDTWETLADAVSAREEQLERDGWAQLRDTFQAHAMWDLAGRPGGSFLSAMNARREAAGLKLYGKSKAYGWLRGGEALARGVSCTTPSEATAAGYALGKALEGSTVPAAVAAVQAQVDAGEHKRKGAVSAPEGCTWRALPLESVDTLEALEARLERVAAVARVDLPGGAPERLATVISAVSALPDEGLAALLGTGEHLLVRVDALAELQRRADLAVRAGLVPGASSESELAG